MAKYSILGTPARLASKSITDCASADSHFLSLVVCDHKKLFVSAFCPTVPPVCASAGVPPMAAPVSDAITPLFDLISSLICSGSRLALNSPVCGSIAVLPSLYRWARCSAAFSAATAAEPPAAKLPPLTRAIAAPKRKCPTAWAVSFLFSPWPNVLPIASEA